MNKGKVNRLAVALMEEEAIGSANRLKFLDNWGFVIVPYDIKLCCQMFFWSGWLTSIRKNIPEYGCTMSELTNNIGIVLCPKCLVKKLKMTKGKDS